MSDYEKLITWILKITVGTLATICFATVCVLLVGLFNEGVDNKDIFEVISPAFNTIVGAFVGLLGGLSLNSRANSSNRESKPSDLKDTK